MKAATFFLRLKDSNKN